MVTLIIFCISLLVALVGFYPLCRKFVIWRLCEEDLERLLYWRIRERIIADRAGEEADKIFNEIRKRATR